MTKKIRCNNCMTVYTEDADNQVTTCTKCETDEFLMDDFLTEFTFNHKGMKFSAVANTEAGAYFEIIRQMAELIEVRCNECDNLFPPEQLRSYKFNPDKWVCEDCHDQLMEEIK